MASKEGNLVTDIEIGEAVLEGGDSVTTCSEEKRILIRTCSGLTKFDGLRGRASEESTSFVSKSGHSTCGNVVVVIERNSGIEYRDLSDFPEKGYSKGTLSKPNSNKHSKPPRPPKGPSLNAYDKKFMMEISEFAAKRHARIQRLKALKKKVTKASSSSTIVAALVVTVLFIVIILQGPLGSRVLP